MKELLRNRALELGFDACRFTSAEPPVFKEHFERWLAAGCHGDMAYLQRNAHKRVDPQKILQDAKSIVVLAVSYSDPRSERSAARPGPQQRRMERREIPVNSVPRPPLEAAAARDVPRSGKRRGPSTGIVARYARYSDYHDVIGERLKTLTAFVNEQAGADARSLWYVDTGPLLERDLAQRAGLGFIGKHTNLISRELGNWFFLAEIITTAEIEPDSAETNRCGTCTRCLDACPTGAITGPFQLDARRCISYLTIELKGPIPEELRPAIGNRIYGCDDCLAVCPWNRFAAEARMMQPHHRSDLETPDLIELLKLDEAGFRQRFAGTPILRAKRRALLRNVCVALGNVGDADALPALERAAADPEPLVAEHAKWAIDQITSTVATHS